MDLKQVAIEADKLARSEIEKYNLPALVHYNLSYKKALWLSNKLKANSDIVKIGIALIDLKLGEAFSRKKISEHVKMSAEAAKEFLSNKVDDKIFNIIINCIEAHHGNTKFESVEAEICANADCYRFIHPTGVFFYLSNLGKRQLTAKEIFEHAEAKLDEKWKILSLKPAKEELEKYYTNFKKLFREANLGLNL